MTLPTTGDTRSAPRPIRHANPTAYDRVLSAAQNPETLVIILFCLVGLVATAYAIHEFPDFGALHPGHESILATRPPASPAKRKLMLLPGAVL